MANYLSLAVCVNIKTNDSESNEQRLTNIHFFFSNLVMFQKDSTWTESDLISIQFNQPFPN